MLGLAAPVWLAALAILAVPLAIHLWSRRPGRIVRVATVRHLTGTPPNVRRLGLHDPWLLLLRLLTLAAAVLVLAEPYARGVGPQAPERWALVAPGVFEDSTRGGPLLDSLRDAGLVVRALAPGLPAAPDAEGGPAGRRTGLWPLLREADHRAPPSVPFLVVAVPRLAAADGDRPTTAREIAWLVPDWLRTADEPDSAPREPEPGHVPELTILAAADRTRDARYVAAAFAAAAAAAPIRTLPPDSTEAAVASAAPGDWLVWLGDAPVPALLDSAAASGAMVLADGAAGGGDAGTALRLLVSEGTAPVAVAMPAADPGDSRARDAAALWSDASGRALLVVRRLGAGLRYDYAGRFDASAGDLVLRPVFPELIARLAVPDIHADDAPQQVSLAQASPAPTGPASAVAGPASTRGRRDLTPLVWGLAALLLIAERVVSARRARA